MADIFEAGNADVSLNELHTREEKLLTRDAELNDLLQKCSTPEERIKILETLTSTNKLIKLIRQERLMVIEIRKINFEKGKRSESS